jgi:hypothetical protein
MKKIVTLLLLICLSIMSFSQKNEPLVKLTKQDYLQKSKKQKKAMSMAIKMQSLPQLQKEDFVNQTIPCLNLKISL